MGSVFMAQWAKDRRKPLLLIAMSAAAILLTLLFAGGSQGPAKVAVFGSGAYGAEAAAAWQRLLHEDGGELQFTVADERSARERVKRGQIPAAVMVTDQDYRLIVASDSPMVGLIERHVRKVFTQELRIRALAAADGADADALRDAVRREMANPAVRVQAQTADGKPVAPHPMGTQLMFAFTLLVAMFIAGFKVNAVTHDKVAGIWNRLILSPVTKTGMYLGYLLYSFCVTFLQTLVVLLLYRYVLNFDLGERFGLVAAVTAVFAFAMISLAMFIAGFITKPEQFYSIYSSAIPLIPLISGAYMMPGTMNVPVLNVIADLFPLSHAMDALMSLVVHDAGWRDILMPVSVMLLLGVVYMGLGINMVERRR